MYLGPAICRRTAFQRRLGRTRIDVKPALKCISVADPTSKNGWMAPLAEHRWREARKSHRSVTVAARQLGPGQVSRIAFVPGASHLSTDSIPAAAGPNQNRRKASTQIHFRRGSDAEKWVDGTVWGSPRGGWDRHNNAAFFGARRLAFRPCGWFDVGARFRPTTERFPSSANARCLP